MGVIKCNQCGKFIHDDEVVWMKYDDTHEVPYCVSCSPEQDEEADSYGDDY